jgi:DNA-binding transcriptional ArsR family regulator
MTTTDEISSVFAALADPTRRAILDRLAAGEATVQDLAAPFPISAQAVSKHLNVLERAGLIVRTRDAQWRRCRLVPAPIREVAAWAEQYRRLWEERYDALDTYLKNLEEEP